MFCFHAQISICITDLLTASLVEGKTVSGDDMSYYRTIEMRLKAKCGSRKFCFDVKTSGSLNAKKTSSTRARKHNVARKKQYTRPTKTWTTALYSI